MVLKCVRRLAQHLLKGQPLPKHVAFIMDGNRRFADRLSLQRIDGHKQGYDQVDIDFFKGNPQAGPCLLVCLRHAPAVSFESWSLHSQC